MKKNPIEITMDESLSKKKFIKQDILEPTNQPPPQISEVVWIKKKRRVK